MAGKRFRTLVALVGRPNVGKSTLFNTLVGARKAIVEDTPGLTRDRHYSEATVRDKTFVIVDTGGFEPESQDVLLSQMRTQTRVAIEQADIVVYIGDGKVGVTPSDHEIVRSLQQANKSIFYVVNKIDSEKQEDLAVDFYALGIDPLFPISAMTGYGLSDFLDTLLQEIPDEVPPGEEAKERSGQPIKVAVVGRPNVGKSTLINLLVGEERLVANPEPGTTRDAIDTMVRYYGKEYLLIDTAGVRRRSRVVDRVEKYSVIKAFRTVDRADIVIMLMDSVEGVTDQDTHIAGYAHEKGRGVILALNKWDLVPKDSQTASKYVTRVREALKYLDHAPVITLSALKGTRAVKLYGIIDDLYSRYTRRISTSEINKFMERVTTSNPPGMYRKTKRIKIYYAAQVRSGPPTFAFFCNHPEAIHFSYRRFLENRLREEFDFGGSPIRLLLRKRQSKSTDGRAHGLHKASGTGPKGATPWKAFRRIK